jgi:proteasome lid subunit RPN8/RPN11
MPPSELTVAVSSLESLDGVTVVEGPLQHEGGSKWVLEVKLQPDEIEAPSQIPQESTWFVLIDSTYPGGSIRIYPAEEGSITATYPHQRLNVAGDEDTPWRKGNICVARYGHIIGRSGATGEPNSPDERLRWHLERALSWLEAASKGELRQEGEPFELPIFGTNSAPQNRVAFNETAESLELWRSEFGNWGFVDFVELTEPSDVFLTEQFRDEDDNVVHHPEWGEYISSNICSQTRGAWLLLEEPPIKPPWEVPETWSDLANLLQDSSIDPFELRANIDSIVEDDAFNCLLLGFPIPSEVGGSSELIHWQAIELSDVRPASELPGFRETPRGKEIAARVDLSRDSIRWLDSDNWAREQLSRRGHIQDPLREASVLLIGAGALGSTVAEGLVRDGCHDLAIVDGETLEIGNLARHTLTLPDVGENKAEALANRLNSVSPHADVDGFSLSFPLEEEEQLEVVESADVVIDCTASNSVLQALNSCRWEEPVLFCSASIGRRGNRLFYFASYSLSFPVDEFQEEFEPWRLQEQIEWQPDEDAVPERVGCWHPASVIRMDQVMTWAGTITRLLEQDASLGLRGTEFRVLESRDDGTPTVSEAEPPFQDVEQWVAPDSGVSVEIPVACLKAIVDICVDANPLETGGILAGSALEETAARIIRASDPPRDSDQGPTAFTRGTERVDEWLREARDSLGIHYLGEWHYHPGGSAELSSPDRAQMNEIASTDEYGCPHPIMFIVGGNPSETLAVRAYLFHRNRSYEELVHIGPSDEPSRPTNSFDLDIDFPNARVGDSQ